MLSTIARRPFEATFIGVWSVYFALIFIFQFDSPYSNFSTAIGYQIGFVVGILIILQLLSRKRPTREPEFGVTSTTIASVAGLLLSAIAIFFLLYAKLQAGVDYSRGICQARYQMNELGRNTTAFSVLGNFLSYSFFVSMTAVLVGHVSRKHFWLSMFCSLSFLMALSFITSSRSAIMLALAFAVASIILRFALSRGLPKLQFLDVALMVVAVGITLGYVSAVFSCRAEALRLSATDYAAQFAPHLGLIAPEEKDTFKPLLLPSQQQLRVPDITPPLVPDHAPTVAPGTTPPATAAKDADVPTANIRGSGPISIIAQYVIHSAYTLDGVITLGNRGGHVLFYYFAELGARVGLTPTPQPWVLAGRFVSLPGAIFHDFGLIGLMLGTLLCGLVAGFIIKMADRYRNNLMVTGFAVAVIATLLLSPIHPAIEFMAFPFILTSFLIIHVIAVLISFIYET